MTHSGKVLQHLSVTWPNGHEGRGHDPLKKNLLSFQSLHHWQVECLKHSGRQGSLTQEKDSQAYAVTNSKEFKKKISSSTQGTQTIQSHSTWSQNPQIQCGGTTKKLSEPPSLERSCHTRMRVHTASTRHSIILLTPAKISSLIATEMPTTCIGPTNKTTNNRSLRGQDTNRVRTSNQ